MEVKPLRLYLERAEIKPEDSNVVWCHLSLSRPVDDVREARAIMECWAHAGGFDASAVGNDLFVNLTAPQRLKSLDARMNWALDLLENKGVIL